VKKFLKFTALAMALLLAFSFCTRWRNADLTALTEARRKALNDVRPALMQYRQDTGKFPLRLEQLVPRYLREIPVALQTRESDEPALRIRYDANGESARFIYHVIRGPDSTETFDVGSNRFEQNR
jgi:hypothetical protein